VTPMQDPLTDLERDRVRRPLRHEILQCRLHEPKRQHGGMGGFLGALEDEAFECVGFRRACDEQVADLRPVELDVFGLHGAHAVAEVVADSDRVGVGFQVVHGDGDVEVRAQEEPETARELLVFDAKKGQ
jgi:hypothetical protein